MSNNKKIRVGLLLDQMETAAWSYAMLQRIISSDYASIELVVLNDIQPMQRRTLFKKIINNLPKIPRVLVRKALATVQDTLIDRIEVTPDAFEQKGLGQLLGGVPVIKVTPEQTKFSDYLSKEATDQIKTHALDVFLRLGFRVLRGDILNSARYGIWSYHHGDNLVNRGGPPGFWETMERWPETGSILQILTEDLDNGKVLCRSYSATDPVSVPINRHNYFWKTLSFIPRKLDELHRVGEQAFFEKVEQHNVHPTFYSRRLYLAPKNLEYAQLLIKKLVLKLKDQYINRFCIDQWILMFDIRDGISESLWRYKSILPPKDRFWADPHVIYENDQYYIFFEEFLYAQGKAHISLLIIDGKGNYQQPVTVLERPYHLSYPFVFQYQDEYYMIPESAKNRTIELYKCKEFPDRWEFHKNLMEGMKAVDTTLFFWNEKWWLFANIAENPGASSCDELFLFYADHPFDDEWTAHPLNPIVSDVKRARPAGKVFIRDGKVYRPSQNCSIRYGYGFNLNEITHLSETEYTERTVSSVKPEWNKKIIGTHTFNHEHKLSIVDAILRRHK